MHAFQEVLSFDLLKDYMKKDPLPLCFSIIYIDKQVWYLVCKSITGMSIPPELERTTQTASSLLILCTA